MDIIRTAATEEQFFWNCTQPGKIFWTQFRLASRDVG
jgi:hypothetical protein